MLFGGRILNIAFFLTPKANVSYLYDDFTIRQALEKLKLGGYTSIPVLKRDGTYVTSVSEGDFLWYLVYGMGEKRVNRIAVQDVEDLSLTEVFREDKTPPIRLTAGDDEIIARAKAQNYIPITDDRGVFIGIVTRKDIIRYLEENGEL